MYLFLFNKCTYHYIITMTIGYDVLSINICGSYIIIYIRGYGDVKAVRFPIVYPV